MKIGNKITLRIVIGMVVLLAIISTAVSILIFNQNRQASTRTINSTFNIVQRNILSKQQQLTNDAVYAASIGEMGSQIQFLAEEKDSGNTMLTESSFKDVAGSLYSILQSSDSHKISVYDMEGSILAFAMDNGNQTIVGYPIRNEKEKKIFVTELPTGTKFSKAEWTTRTELKKIQTSIASDNIPKKLNKHFTVDNGYLSLSARAPCSSSIFDKKSDSIKQVQVGFTVAIFYLNKNFAANLASLTNADINIFTGHELSAGTLSAYETITDTESYPANRDHWRLSSQDIIYDKITVKKNNQSYFTGSLPVYQNARNIGIITALVSTDIAWANTFQAIKIVVLISLIGCVVMIPINLALIRQVIRPVKNVVEGLKNIAQGKGDLTRRLEVRGQDEVGELASWFNSFIETMQGMIKDISNDSQTLEGASGDLSSLASQMSSGAGDVSSKAESVSQSAEQTSNKINSVASAMEESTTTLHTIASSAEQMTTTITDIAQHSGKASEITENAVSETKKASERIDELGKAAEEIGVVTETITEISEQTNLLALNATIEAARAGEAGKGFAVVADEIKQLARQTAEATEQIKDKIGGIQSSTSTTVNSIDNIMKVIEEVNNIVSTIATAVEEQSVTTKEIASNVSQASQGISDTNNELAYTSSVAVNIADEIADVNRSASEISQTSDKLNDSAEELKNLSVKLSQMVGKFKV